MNRMLSYLFWLLMAVAFAFIFGFIALYAILSTASKDDWHSNLGLVSIHLVTA